MCSYSFKNKLVVKDTNLTNFDNDYYEKVKLPKVKIVPVALAILND